jgi:hypothetical protein
MGIHAGGAECRDGDCDGLTLNRAARLMSIGYGGQVLVSDAAETLTRNDRRAGAAFANLGKHDDACRMHLADLLGEAERCWAISYARTPRRFERLRLEFRGTSPPARIPTATDGGEARCSAPARGSRRDTGSRARCRNPRGDSGPIERPLPGRQKDVAGALARSLIRAPEVPVCAS